MSTFTTEDDLRRKGCNGRASIVRTSAVQRALNASKESDRRIDSPRLHTEPPPSKSRRSISPEAPRRRAATKAELAEMRKLLDEYQKEEK